MREAGKKKMETQLPHLWNPHKIKKIRQDETEIQNINLGGTCTRRLSPSAEAFGFGWQGYVQENSSFDCSSPSFWLSQYTL